MSATLSPEIEAAAGRTYRGATIAWGRGECYDFETPNPEVITIEDVAYALAFTCRWRGQTRFRGARCFYGVGQHCVFGAEEMLAAGLGTAHALGFLLHELDEVALPDFPGPAKMCVPGFREFARKQGDALHDRLGWPGSPDADLCKRWDIRMLNTEKRDLMAGHERDTFHNSHRELASVENFPPFERVIVPYPDPEEAALEFLKLCHQLGLTNEFGDLR